MPELTEAAQTFLRAMASPTRQALVMQLADGGERNVTELAEAAGLGVPTASEHLTQLRRAGVVRARRTGKQVRYEADPDGIRAALGDLTSFLDACCPPSR